MTAFSGIFWVSFLWSGWQYEIEQLARRDSPWLRSTYSEMNKNINQHDLRSDVFVRGDKIERVVVLIW